MHTLLDDNRFFELADLYEQYQEQIEPHERLYFIAHIDNAKGRYSISNDAIKELITKYRNQVSAKKTAELLSISSDNYAKQYDYRSAAEALRTIVENHRFSLGKKELRDLSNALALWGALSGVPAQRLSREPNAPPYIPIRYNHYNHWLIEVSNSTWIETPKEVTNAEFIFDSGANMSVVKESMCKRLGVIRSKNSVKIGNSVGSELQSQVGYIPTIYIGGVKIENMVVLILADHALNVGDYKIDGIIGFPVIQSFGEFSISRNAELKVSLRDEIESIEPNERALQNIFTCGFTPFIQVITNGRTGNFIFDTGARTSHMTKKYFQQNRRFFTASKRDKLQMGGAGEIKHIERCTVSDCTIEVAGQMFELTNLDVLLHKGLNIASYDGFLGQDILLQSEKVVINLKDMYLYFEEK